MVAMQMTFGNCDQQTPHGGPPFQGWRKGHGFGYAKGPGCGNVLHPAAAVQLRFTPNGDRGLASGPFWRGKWELGPATSFGVGDRPSLYHSADVTIGPDNYGDVSKLVGNVRRKVVRPGIKLKARFPSVEEKARDYSWPSAGPGPAKYNIAGAGAKTTGFTFGVKSMSSTDLKEQIAKPGPDYNVRIKAGKNAPDRHGTLYDCSMHGKIRRFGVGEASPGPARYNVRGQLDQYGLWDKIANVPGPPAEYWKDRLRPAAGGQPLGQAAAAFDDGAAPEARGLSRVESSPV
mmetsp:Transcript_14073/g.40555  ORF Transcript_14073/g.40555 Transcript_14073/m.40555 type:complete len:289 (-) Transcript_14073:19-885(-)